MSAGPFITLENVSVRAGGRWVLNGLSWQIDTGRNWVVWGSNGSGKTTLAKALAGDAPVVQGNIRRHYDGLPHQGIGLVSSDQHLNLVQREKWLEEMAHFSGRQTSGISVSEVLPDQNEGSPHDRIDIARMLGLEGLVSKSVGVLSAGEMRKLLIARALMKQPRLLILDEPFNGLDAASQTQLLSILNQLGQAGIQMVLITHRMAEIPPAFTHLLHIENGTSKWQGPVRDFFDLLETSKPSSLPGAAYQPEPAHTASPPRSTDSEDTPLILMQDVSVSYGFHRVLSGIDWTVLNGENWALIGPNGAGKSTLLRLITGDNLQGYANKIVLFGRPKGSGESIWQIKKHIGYVADDLQLRYQKKMSAFEVVCSGFFDSVGLYRRASESQKQTARKWLETTGIQDLAHRLFSTLSFGQQRMVLIVRAMVKIPRLLILDEPCNGLDAANRRRLLAMLDVIGRTPSTSLLYVSHRPEEIPACITHRLYLEAGMIREIAATDGPINR